MKNQVNDVPQLPLKKQWRNPELSLISYGNINAVKHLPTVHENTGHYQTSANAKFFFNTKGVGQILTHNGHVTNVKSSFIS